MRAFPFHYIKKVPKTVKYVAVHMFLRINAVVYLDIGVCTIMISIKEVLMPSFIDNDLIDNDLKHDLKILNIKIYPNT